MCYFLEKGIMLVIIVCLSMFCLQFIDSIQVELNDNNNVRKKKEKKNKI